MNWLKRAIVKWHLRWMREHPEEWMHSIMYEGGTVTGYGPPRTEDGFIVGSERG